MSCADTFALLVAHIMHLTMLPTNLQKRRGAFEKNNKIKNNETLLPLFAALASFASDLIPVLGFLLAAVHLHKTLLHGVIRAPLEFYDQTPVGRILSRFSKDTDVIDTGLPHQINGFIYCFHEVKWWWRRCS